jgi:hypothetical protein
LFGHADFKIELADNTVIIDIMFKKTCITPRIKRKNYAFSIRSQRFGNKTWRNLSAEGTASAVSA